jgi:hypothetical protein
VTRVVKYNNNPRRNLKIYWKQFYPDWEIPKGYHVHHIKPKCTFDDSADPRIHHPRNLIALHPDDHWLIHKLRGDKNVNWPFINVIGEKKQPCSKATKKKISEANKGKTAWNKGISSGKGIKKSEITKQRMRKPKSAEHCENIRKARLGTTLRQETKDRISVKAKGRILDKTECPYCLRSFDPGNYKKNHGDKCKMVGITQ